MKDKEDYLLILRKINKTSSVSQRQLAHQLGFSLGKVNYCLKELKKKGLVKLENFRSNNNKTNYIWILTPKGILEKTRLTINFMKRNQSLDSKKNFSLLLYYVFQQFSLLLKHPQIHPTCSYYLLSLSQLPIF